MPSVFMGTRPREYRRDFGVARLFESLIPIGDRLKDGRRENAGNLVGFMAQHEQGVRRCDR